MGDDVPWELGMEDLDVTVLIAAHNQAETLPTALAHLELQTYPAAGFEVLVVDVASSDDTGGVLGRYAAGAPVATRCIREESASMVAARNRGSREARGRIVLFLDQQLLAGPQLVEQHVAAHQRHEGRACIVGNITTHPQLAPDSFVPSHVFERQRLLKENAHLHFLDCRSQNMSLSRQLLLEHGGFDEAFPFPHFAGAELVWRYAPKGMRAYFAREAAAYVWRATGVDAERRRFYEMGYCVNLLARKTQAAEVLRRYPLERGRFNRWFGLLAARPSALLCEHLSQDTHAFKQLYSRVLDYEFQRGYHDARRGHAPRAARETEEVGAALPGLGAPPANSGDGVGHTV
ncbi:MAG: glycosyltransferase family 2 protein [Candidatus Hydrogenedentes bacterium]|nr:glycosyltransferase family 2 protein [Candidatus Hydrogenedentota bacterium]